MSPNQEDKNLATTKPVPPQVAEQPKPQWLEMIIERYPEQIGDLLKTLPVVISQ